MATRPDAGELERDLPHLDVLLFARVATTQWIEARQCPQGVDAGISGIEHMPARSRRAVSEAADDYWLTLLHICLASAV